MSYRISTEVQIQTKLKKILTEIKNKGNLVGIILSTKDGRLIVKSLSEKDMSEFIAMHASVLKSAENLGSSMDNRNISNIITELESKTILTKNCTPNTFLILIFDKKSKVDTLLKNLDKYIKQISVFVERLNL
ncbi:MAG: roadblock/LC7 domain-containing protein [Candidatus Lokiarchaeota archaeon]